MSEQITLEKVIDFAVQVEMKGRHLYTTLAERFREDAEMHTLFATLAEDEQHHADHFGKLRAVAASRPPLSDEQQNYLRAASVSEIFSAEKGIEKNLDKIDSREDALERAFNLEKASLLYYQAMKEVLQDDLLDSMIQEEKGHLTQVMRYMVTGAKMRGLGDKF